ncbi:hypothetical protein THAOC_22506, partial [Thalassiosira oceanica]
QTAAGVLSRARPLSEGQSESTMAIWPRVVDAYSVQWPPPRRLALLEANLTLGHLAAEGDRAVRIQSPHHPSLAEPQRQPRQTDSGRAPRRRRRTGWGTGAGS